MAAAYLLVHSLVTTPQLMGVPPIIVLAGVQVGLGREGGDDGHQKGAYGGECRRGSSSLTPGSLQMHHLAAAAPPSSLCWSLQVLVILLAHSLLGFKKLRSWVSFRLLPLP